jgi:predicted metal-dependent phosphoesterase TrpH
MVAPFSGQPRKAFVMKIDLHVHTRERSPCGRSTEDEMIQAAIALGLDAVALTDHDRLAPPERLAMLNAKYAPFRVFGGIEVSLGRDHALVLGIQDRFLEEAEWTYKKLHEFVDIWGGFLAVAHPFRFYRRMNDGLLDLPPHAMEVYSHNTPPRAESRIRRLAEQWEIPLLANSDAHQVAELGAHYNELTRTPADDAELVEMLRAGEFRPVSRG